MGIPILRVRDENGNVYAIPAIQGVAGNGIASIALKSGTHAPGTTDTYEITFTDGTTFDFFVYNGANGTGAGDMLASTYDPQGKVQDIFAYVDNAVSGVTPHIDETTKHWMIGNADTGIVAEGKTAYIGDNGNWYVWDATSGAFVDSGVSAKPLQYVQPNEPIDAPEFSLWVDTDEEAVYIARAEGVGF